MDIVLLASALIPAIVLMVYVYSRDKVEREPAGLVARVFFIGAASGIVAGIVESILIDTLEALLPAGMLLLVIEYFICVAAVEELCKFASLNTVKKNPAFDYVFDAVVYSVAAALGFAALENVFYVFDGGLETALMRAILSVPGHAADGVVMGVFYGIARRHELHGRKGAAKVHYCLAILLPTIEHGFYDMALSMESDFMAFVAIIFDLVFVIVAFVLVKRTAAKDAPLHPAGAAQGSSVQAPSYTPTPVVPQAVRPPAQPTMPAQPTLSQQPGQYSSTWSCPSCGTSNAGNFCVNCGQKRP